MEIAARRICLRKSNSLRGNISDTTYTRSHSIIDSCHTSSCLNELSFAMPARDPKQMPVGTRPGTRHRHPVPGTRYPVPGTRYKTSRICSSRFL